MRNRLAVLLPEERERQSGLLCEAVLASPGWNAANVVMMFSPLPDEPDVSRLHQPESPKRYIYPRVAGQAIALHEVPDPAQLVPGSWGIREPLSDPATMVSPDVIDLALVPGLAFSRLLQRLGRGAGFYDRFLPNLRPDAIKLGVCFDFQLVDALPSEAHDIPMDALVTETVLLT